MGEGGGGGGDSAEDYAPKQTNILAHANVSLLADKLKYDICPTMTFQTQQRPLLSVSSCIYPARIINTVNHVCLEKVSFYFTSTLFNVPRCSLDYGFPILQFIFYFIAVFSLYC